MLFDVLFQLRLERACVTLIRTTGDSWHGFLLTPRQPFIRGKKELYLHRQPFHVSGCQVTICPLELILFPVPRPLDVKAVEARYWQSTDHMSYFIMCVSVCAECA